MNLLVCIPTGSANFFVAFVCQGAKWASWFLIAALQLALAFQLSLVWCVHSQRTAADGSVSRLAQLVHMQPVRLTPLPQGLGGHWCKLALHQRGHCCGHGRVLSNVHATRAANSASFLHIHRYKSISSRISCQAPSSFVLLHIDASSPKLIVRVPSSWYTSLL